MKRWFKIIAVATTLFLLGAGASFAGGRGWGHGGYSGHRYGYHSGWTQHSHGHHYRHHHHYRPHYYGPRYYEPHYPRSYYSHPGSHFGMWQPGVSFGFAFRN